MQDGRTVLLHNPIVNADFHGMQHGTDGSMGHQAPSCWCCGGGTQGDMLAARWRMVIWLHAWCGITGPTGHSVVHAPYSDTFASANEAARVTASASACTTKARVKAATTASTWANRQSLTPRENMDPRQAQQRDAARLEVRPKPTPNTQVTTSSIEWRSSTSDNTGS